MLQHLFEYLLSLFQLHLQFSIRISFLTKDFVFVTCFSKYINFSDKRQTKHNFVTKSDQSEVFDLVHIQTTMR
jgi:hypothetical protein